MAPDASKRRIRFSLRSLILFVTLAGSGYGLWARWEPWVPIREFVISYDANYPGSGMYIYAHDLHSSEEGLRVTVSMRVLQSLSGPSTIHRHHYLLDVATGLTTKTIGASDIYKSESHPALKAQDGPAYSSDRSVRAIITGYSERQFKVRASRSRRPEYWWGVAWLPEFWLTVVFTGVLLWSIRRDMLILKTAAEPNSA